MNLDRDFKEFIECLNAHDVTYLVVGGYAVGAAGRSQDIADADRLEGLND